jgi:hypothetical protein
MKQQILGMTGLSEDQFYKRYPTEDSFFRDYPQAKQMLHGGATSKAGYGKMIPRAYGGMQVSSDPPGTMPDQRDYPDYESWAQAWDEWMSRTQETANTAQVMPQGMTAQNAGTSAGAAPKFQLKDYQGVSVQDFLTSQGKAGDFKSRKNLAKILGIFDYKGTPEQNKLMIELIRTNPDVLESYQGAAVLPKGNAVKKSATSQNRKAVPTTQELARTKNNTSSNVASGTTSGRVEKSGYALSPFEQYMESSRLAASPHTFTPGKYYEQEAPVQRVQKSAYELTPFELEMERQRAMIPPYTSRPGVYYKEEGGNVYPDGYSGTYSAGQYYGEGGSFMPQYADSAYGLPQYELGAPTYADGGMSPEQAMMMEQMGAQQAPPQQGGPQQQFDQEQLMNAIAQMMQQGMQPDQIMQQLVSMGVPEVMASELLKLVMQQMQGAMPTGMEQQGSMPPGGMPPEGMMPPPMGMYGGSYADGGMVGQEMEVTPQQLEDLRRRGIQFEIV